MENILSFSTIDKNIKLLLIKNINIVDYIEIREDNKHSEFLIKEIENILKNNSLEYDDIDIFSSINGPGNFTSIKVAISVLKTLKLLTNKKIILCNYFEIMKNSAKLNEIPIIKSGLNYYKFIPEKNDVEIVDFENLNTISILTDNEDLCKKFNNARLYNFDKKDWIDAIQNKIKNNDFVDEINPLYIQPAQITKRKS